MTDHTETLSPPKRTNTADPGAHDLADSSESEDHYSDAQSEPSESKCPSPVPKTRVEKVSDEPSYGEVPGTEAYRKRESDAAPDEIAVIPDAAEKQNQTGGQGEAEQPPPPGGRPVPLTVVDETEDSAGSVTHPEKHHTSDPPPDVIHKVKEPAETEKNGGDSAADTQISTTPIKSTSPTLSRGAESPPSSSESPVSPKSPSPPADPGLDAASDVEPGPAVDAASPTEAQTKDPSVNGANPVDGDDDAGEDDFGDDFDDFEEGGADGDGFGDFDDGFQEPAPEPPRPAQAAAPPPVHSLSFPIPDFDGLDVDEILAVTEPYLNAIYPPEDEDAVPAVASFPRDSPIFQTPRSASLWAQLVAPPPLQPPDWIRSRIRRLFLVSLGVPVDLDEILPASKQKKLVLPSLHRVSSNGSFRTSTDSRSNISRLKQADNEANASTTSLDSQGKPRGGPGGSQGSGRRNKGAHSEPALDLVASKQLCMTTEEALNGMTDKELKEHVAKLEALEGLAKQSLEYWKKKTDEKIGDREAFEGVIENLVKHARKVRK